MAGSTSFADDGGCWFWSLLALLLWIPGGCLLACGITGRHLPLPLWLGRASLVCWILGVLFSLSVILPVLFSLSGDEWQKADTVILLCTLPEEDGSLSPLTEERVRLAAAYLTTYPEATVIVTGGGIRGGVTEADAAAAALLAAGIDAERILTEETARSTAENFKASAALLPQGASAVVITSDFHAFRAGICARSAGLGNLPVLTSPSGGILFPHYVIREWMALTRSVLDGTVSLFPKN